MSPQESPPPLSMAPFSGKKNLGLGCWPGGGVGTRPWYLMAGGGMVGNVTVSHTV